MLRCEVFLLCSGDVETNPGPPTHPSASWDVDNEQTTAQSTAILEILKSINERTIDLAESQGDKSSDNKAIKYNQETIKTGLWDIFNLLEASQHEANIVNALEQDIVSIRSFTAHLKSQKAILQMRWDDLDHRSSRITLLFRVLKNEKKRGRKQRG